ncbi:metallophosphoesterase, partial [Bifidobacterium breve]
MTTLRFRGDGHGDGTFRVLQMADVQDGPDVDPDTVALIEAAIREAKPDLVVFTGDQIRGYDPAWMRTFLRRRGERPGDHVREVTRFEAWWRRTFDGTRL